MVFLKLIKFLFDGFRMFMPFFNHYLKFLYFVFKILRADFSQRVTNMQSDAQHHSGAGVGGIDLLTPSLGEQLAAALSGTGPKACFKPYGPYGHC